MEPGVSTGDSRVRQLLRRRESSLLTYPPGQTAYRSGSAKGPQFERRAIALPCTFVVANIVAVVVASERSAESFQSYPALIFSVGPRLFHFTDQVRVHATSDIYLPTHWDFKPKTTLGQRFSPRVCNLDWHYLLVYIYNANPSRKADKSARPWFRDNPGTVNQRTDDRLHSAASSMPMNNLWRNVWKAT